MKSPEGTIEVEYVLDHSGHCIEPHLGKFTRTEMISDLVVNEQLPDHVRTEERVREMIVNHGISFRL